ncbi:hypothetical protein AGMMS49921_13650 [Endomicrobiia bacterium]|nr:hypothetical protein AGMMS49921_13650 [Endomicrobiia bacterium]
MNRLGMDGIPENAWYKYSDKEMRQLIGAAEGEQLEVSHVVLLQIKSGIKENDAKVWPLILSAKICLGGT